MIEHLPVQRWPNSDSLCICRSSAVTSSLVSNISNGSYIIHILLCWIIFLWLTLWSLEYLLDQYNDIKHIIQNSSLCTRCEITLKWMPWNLTNEKPTLVQVMVCCLMIPMSQCWSRSLSPYVNTRPHWVNTLCGSSQIIVVKQYCHATKSGLSFQNTT